MSGLRSQRGQGSAEYAGLLALVALVVAALLALGVPDRLASALDDAVCAVTGEGCDPAAGPDPGTEPRATNPLLSDADREALLGDPRAAQDVLDSLSEGERAWLVENDPEAAGGVERAIGWREEREVLDRYLDSELEEYLAYRDSAGRDERMDFSTDECSAPVVGNTGLSYDFTAACVRHDFGYRNAKDLGLFEDYKDRIDNRFLDDMKEHCEGRSVFLRGDCYSAAYTYYYAVRAFG